MQALLGATMAFGVANRVLYKMALVPLGDYVFFLAQFQTFGCEAACALLGCCSFCGFSFLLPEHCTASAATTAGSSGIPAQGSKRVVAVQVCPGVFLGALLAIQVGETSASC